MALLVALAALAERAGFRSQPVRCLVLWILRRAETVAGEFVFEAAGMPPPALEGIAAVGNGSADALRLAARFKALAAMLAVLLPVARRLDRKPQPRGCAFGHVAPGSGLPLGCCTRMPNDTS